MGNRSDVIGDVTPSDEHRIAQGAAGFFLQSCSVERRRQEGASPVELLLRHFPWLSHDRIDVGPYSVWVWGHGVPSEWWHRDASGRFWLLVGSPSNRVPWASAVQLFDPPTESDARLPWEGRSNLIHIEPNRGKLTVITDWCGSIPVYASRRAGLPVLSTHEPSVVSALGLGVEQMSRHGIVEMLLLGEFLGATTLYRDISVLGPDGWHEFGDDMQLRSRTLWSVSPSDARWGEGWDPMVEGLHEETVRVISDLLRSRSHWVVPLSGGMDSRLIACVGVEAAVRMNSFTYGTANSVEIALARKVARRLGIRWTEVRIGTGYLSAFTPMWFDWFGATMAAHGMYQMPFLERVRGLGPIANGYFGDPLAGNHVERLFASGESHVERYLGFAGMRAPDTLRQLLDFDAVPLIEALRAEIDGAYCQLRGADYQRMMYLDFWNHQRRTISYHPAMYDYFNGVGNPFMDRRYAVFCLSLPRCALDQRRLQKAMVERYWPKLASLPSTAFRDPLIPTPWSEMRKRILWRAPAKLRAWACPASGAWVREMQAAALRRHGIHALPPLDEGSELPSFLRKGTVKTIVERALQGDGTSYDCVTAIQPLAWRCRREH